VTDEEVYFLRALCRTDQQSLLPQGTSVEQLRQFDELVESLKRMQKAGWIELEVAEGGTRKVKGYRRRYRAAAARCTEEGKRALDLLGS
jgi:hypothetical protein